MMNSAIDFEQGLRATLEADPKLSRRGAKILAILNHKPSKRRTRQLERMERHARAELAVDKIDWSTIDWGKIIETILALLLKLLPLLIL